MNQSGLGRRRTPMRWITVAASVAAIVGLAACEPAVPGDGAAPTSALAATTWTAHGAGEPTAGTAFEVGSTVLPTRGAVDDLVLVQSFPAGVAVEKASGVLEAWDPIGGELIQRDASCEVAGQVAWCVVEGTVDADWAIDRLEIRALVSAATPGSFDVTLDASATDPGGVDPTPVHQVTTITVAG